MNEYEQVESKYGLILPEAYRSMCAAGWCDVKSDNYFWLYEAEWMSLTEIVNYQPAEYHKPGFVPFAFTGGGDYWCWWPSEHPAAVVLCPHDCEEGEFYAPSFIGFIYRSLLDYSRYVSTEDEHEDEVRQNLREATMRLQNYFPAAWLDTLNILVSAPLVQSFLPNGREAGWGLGTNEQYQETIQRDLAFPLLDQRFQWMYSLSEDEAETAKIWRKIILESGPNVPIEEKIAQVEAEQARRKNEA